MNFDQPPTFLIDQEHSLPNQDHPALSFHAAKNGQFRFADKADVHRSSWVHDSKR